MLRKPSACVLQGSVIKSAATAGAPAAAAPAASNMDATSVGGRRLLKGLHMAT